MTKDPNNPVGLRGLSFIEFAATNPAMLEELWLAFGFSRVAQHKQLDVDLYLQNNIKLLVNRANGSFGASFSEEHGPSIPAMGWLVDNATDAYLTAIERGASPAPQCDYTDQDGKPLPAIQGIGSSLIYFVEPQQDANKLASLNFVDRSDPIERPNLGFNGIDHLTNNVPEGEMNRWADFYKKIFGFTEVRYFDIRGAKTGLVSYALQAPNNGFCIPINEGTEEKSQINEYLREYKGAGVQHIAFTTDNIVQSLRSLSATAIETLDIDDDYYAEVFDRVPNVTEDKQALQELNILVDGDEQGYLLQIFTKNLIGPIFIEIIQRKNHNSFGEGNFGALFRSIERDQERRGTLA